MTKLKLEITATITAILLAVLGVGLVSAGAIATLIAGLSGFQAWDSYGHLVFWNAAPATAAVVLGSVLAGLSLYLSWDQLPGLDKFTLRRRFAVPAQVAIWAAIYGITMLDYVSTPMQAIAGLLGLLSFALCWPIALPRPDGYQRGA